MPPKRPNRKGQHDRQRIIGGQKPQSGQNISGGSKPGQGTKPQPAAPTPPPARPPAANQSAPQPTPAALPPEPPPPEAITTTERGQPREEQVSMQTASSSTVTHPTHHHKVRSIHYSLNYALQGQEHGTDGAVVLLHGLPGDSFSWRHIMPALADQRAVYAFDMLSYGKSDHPWPADVSIWGRPTYWLPACARSTSRTSCWWAMTWAAVWRRSWQRAWLPSASRPSSWSAPPVTPRRLPPTGRCPICSSARNMTRLAAPLKSSWPQ